MQHTDASKFEACLLGLAIGDALGMPFEGWRPTWILSRIGDKVRDFQPCPARNLNAGQWTDDTKMALALAGSIARSDGFNPADAALAYLEWFETGDLRGIGGATSESILRLKNGVPWNQSGKPGRMAAGNGTAMRAAPIGLLHCHNIDQLLDNARNDALITHANDEAVAGSQAVALAVARGVTAKGFTGADVTLLDDIARIIGDTALARNIQKAKQLFIDKTPVNTALQKLGTSGHVVETVASALYCFISSPDNFETTVINAVMGGADTDTTAAIAGAVSGAWNGTWNLPRRWLDTLEANHEIRSIAGKLYSIAESTL